ncbi:phosphoribosyltransferase [Micromonospora sp. WMMA1363]|uniref:phosphoribosyltransferase n=1 Tax=Micromonospora sp. WMMA1363 TaxID=3053985 RepID=UPI00259CA353|nr:phosphoribosyltransferase [Micromonospora sp. WMMA1363]MDM4722803.1 phosphoribosyltransferase [Micromonospora sp. WMMA1363]
MTATAREVLTAGRVTRLGVGDTTRPIRIVHELDGVRSDTAPEQVMAAGNHLWRRWRQHPAYRPHDVLLGLDAGGIIPTLAVAWASGSHYRIAWKVNLDLPEKLVFHEPHARRLEVFAYGRFKGQRVLIVDDEITTGLTLTNLVTALRDAGADVTGVLCLVEDTTGGGRKLFEQHEVPLCVLTAL